MTYPKKLTANQADKLYHRYMSVKDGGVCSQYICVNSLDCMNLHPDEGGTCIICAKLFGDRMCFFYRGFVEYEYSCPCDRFKHNKGFILQRVKQALEDFYGEEL